MKVQVGEFWYDQDEYIAQQEFIKQRELEIWDWIFYGRRTIDLFGIEGAKRILEIQARGDRKLMFNHKSRGIY